MRLGGEGGLPTRSRASCHFSCLALSALLTICSQAGRSGGDGARGSPLPAWMLSSEASWGNTGCGQEAVEGISHWMRWDLWQVWGSVIAPNMYYVTSTTRQVDVMIHACQGRKLSLRRGSDSLPVVTQVDPFHDSLELQSLWLSPPLRWVASLGLFRLVLDFLAFASLHKLPQEHSSMSFF